MTATGATDRNTRSGGNDETDVEILRLKYGKDWNEHVVPHPDAFEKATGIGDLAPGAENDTPPERRRAKSRTLLFRISSSCAGHGQPPTPAELYDAFHTKEPTARSSALLRMWMTEASSNEVIDAWRDHCYTWRELAAACHRHGITDAENAPIMNRMPQRRDGHQPARR